MTKVRNSLERVFDRMEANRAALSVTGYTVAQTSLEHVIDIIVRDAGPARGSVTSLLLANPAPSVQHSAPPPDWASQVTSQTPQHRGRTLTRTAHTRASVG